MLCVLCPAPPRPVCLCERMMLARRLKGDTHPSMRCTLLRSVVVLAFRSVGSGPVRVFVVGLWRALGTWALTGAACGAQAQSGTRGFRLLPRARFRHAVHLWHRFILGLEKVWGRPRSCELHIVQIGFVVHCETLNLHPLPPHTFDGNMSSS